MKYTFDLVGISPVLSFFYQQQELQEQLSVGVEYVGNQKCRLDTFIASVEQISPNRGWDLDQAVDSVINFWVNNSERVQYWRTRLDDAGQDNLLVARVADLKSLKSTFESLLGES